MKPIYIYIMNYRFLIVFFWGGGGRRGGGGEDQFLVGKDFITLWWFGNCVRMDIGVGKFMDR